MIKASFSLSFTIFKKDRNVYCNYNARNETKDSVLFNYFIKECLENGDCAKVLPCKKCGHFLILYEDEQMCPNCRSLALLDSETATRVTTRLVTLFTKIFHEELRRWERDTLLGNLVAGREFVARTYFEKYSVLDVGRLSAYTILIRRTAKFSDFRGTVPNEKKDVDELVDKFESVMEFESIVLNVKSGYKNILYLKKFDVDNFTIEEAKETFRIVRNESYLTLEKTFSSHDIFQMEKAEEVFKEYQKDYKAPDKPIEVVFIPPDEYIKKHYHILNQIFALFHRDRASAECFNPPILK